MFGYRDKQTGEMTWYTTGKAMQWHKASKLARMNAQDLRGKKIIPVKLDNSFWMAWRDDPKGMKAAGYHVRKDQRGRWQAWIER
jgi:hypothetical protein